MGFEGTNVRVFGELVKKNAVGFWKGKVRKVGKGWKVGKNSF